jgi:hypothetical protein
MRQGIGMQDHAGRPSKEEKNKYEQATKSWKQKQAKCTSKPNKSARKLYWSNSQTLQTMATRIQNARLLEHAMDK